MSCSCRKGKRLSSIETKEIEELIKFIRNNPKAFKLILEVVNSFRPTDGDRIKTERVFLAVKDILELGLLSYARAEKVLKVLKEFFLKGDKHRGDFLEILVSKLGPFTFKGRHRRVNQCKVYLGNKKLSEKEIDVAFSGKEVLELHECKVNQVRQWREPLGKRGKRGGKLYFLNSLPVECKGKKVVPCTTGLDGELGSEYAKLVFKFYGYKRIKVLGRKELYEKLIERLKNSV
ncbi:hypothetical protein [Thermovibrio sp.]